MSWPRACAPPALANAMRSRRPLRMAPPMFRQRTVRFIALAVALAAFLMAGGASASGVARTRPRPVPGAPAERAPVVSAAPDVPGIDPDYIYGQLDYLATHFLHREAGY